MLKLAGHDAGIDVGFYALVGMGAVLAAVVHAPLASILILFEVTGGVAQGQQNIILPAMLACVVATGTAQLIFRDSVYTLTLRRRGVRVGSGADLSLLRRLTLEQVELEPVHSVGADDPFEKLLQLTENGASDFVVLDRNGTYAGMVIADDIKTALLQREAIPLLTVGEMVRPELAPGEEHRRPGRGAGNLQPLRGGEAPRRAVAQPEPDHRAGRAGGG